jgi:hypothetical protein
VADPRPTEEAIVAIRHLAEYVGLLFRLHELDPFGNRENTPEMDDICEAMDGPGRFLTDSERVFTVKLSEDLYALTEKVYRRELEEGG